MKRTCGTGINRLPDVIVHSEKQAAEARDRHIAQGRRSRELDVNVQHDPGAARCLA